MNYWLYFWFFLKSSLLSFGGLGNLPFLHADLIPLGWATEQDFMTAIAVGQISPGPNGTWSISLGYLTEGWMGAILALLGILIPTILVLLVDLVYKRIQKFQVVQNFASGMALGAISLTIGTAWKMAPAAITDWVGIVIAIVTLGLALTKKVPVILILVLAAAIGIVIYL
jgi:chromate transporter